LFNHIGNRRPEIDIMEAYAGGGVNSGWSDANLHPTAYGATIWIDASVNGGYKMIQTPDLSAGFHKYAIKWEPNRQTFYFDGQEVYSTAVTMGDPMYIMLDLWFGSASGTPDNSTPTGKSNSYEVNYVRAWKAN
jgi:beta-glucanase (GH16 family)